MGLEVTLQVELVLRLNRYREAEAALQKAPELAPDSEEDRRLLEQARDRQGRPRRWWRR